MLYATITIISAAGCHVAFSYYEAAKRRRALLAKQRRQNGRSE
jgi:hypothetical protein